MPNSTFVQGSPVLNAIKGFDRPEELLYFEGADGFCFIGYDYQVVSACLGRDGNLYEIDFLIKKLSEITI